MNKLLIGMTLGALVGAVAYKKMEENKIPEKAIKKAEKKLKNLD